MKIENEIEKLVKRVSLIETQNSRFKNLLDSALEVTKQSLSGTSIQRDESGFLQETIKLIEDEKGRMQEDLDILTSTETDGIFYFVKQLEADSVELRKKIEVLINHAQKQSKDIDQLKTEHMEFKFLLTQPNSNTEWLKDVIRIDNHLSGSGGAILLKERFNLQKKIVNLENKKTELLTAIEKMDQQKTHEAESPKSVIRADLERSLFKAIDEAARKKYEDLHLKVLNLEKERSQLLTNLQDVLDKSRKEIADEYGELQKKILDIEAERAELNLNLKFLHDNEELRIKLKDTIGNDNEEKLAIDKILNAFSNKASARGKFAVRRKDKPVRFNSYSSLGLPPCNIL